MRLPVAFQSLLIQIAACMLAALAAWGLHAEFDVQPSLWQWAFAQGGLAAGLSFAWRQPTWWWPLHAGFLPAALGGAQLAVPAWVYLAAFVLLGLFFWTTFRTRVPLYLSDRKAWDAVATQLPSERAFRLVDLGSGLGGLLFYLEQRFPQGRFAGIEVAPGSWLISRLVARWRGSGVRFERRDYAGVDLGAFDVVFAFLSPAAMPALWHQACKQMAPGSLFLSLSFHAGGRDADFSFSFAEGARHTLYGWRM